VAGQAAGGREGKLVEAKESHLERLARAKAEAEEEAQNRIGELEESRIAAERKEKELQEMLAMVEDAERAAKESAAMLEDTWQAISAKDEELTEMAVLKAAAEAKEATYVDQLNKVEDSLEMKDAELQMMEETLAAIKDELEGVLEDTPTVAKYAAAVDQALATNDSSVHERMEEMEAELLQMLSLLHLKRNKLEVLERTTSSDDFLDKVYWN